MARTRHPPGVPAVRQHSPSSSPSGVTMHRAILPLFAALPWVLATALGAALVASPLMASPPPKTRVPNEAPSPAAPKPAGASAAPSPIRVPVATLSFLAGAWKGPMGPDTAEEIWSAPRGSSLMGCFRWIDSTGTANMFEILTITEEKDATRMRLRHFSPTLVAKEAGETPMTFVATEHAAARIVFSAEKDAGGIDRIVYEVVADELRIDVEFSPPTGEAKPRQPLKFRLRQKA